MLKYIKAVILIHFSGYYIKTGSMKYMKKIRRKYYKIFISAFVFSLLLTNVTYADNQTSESAQIKELKQEIKHSLAVPNEDVQPLIDLYVRLLDCQKNSQLYQDAIQTALKIEDLTSELCGENSEELYNAKLETLSLYTEVRDEKQRKNKLAELEKFASVFSDSMKYRYYKSLAEYYSNYEDFHETDEILNKMYSLPNLSPDEKLEVIRKLAENYSYLRDIKNTNKYLEEYYKLCVLYEQTPYEWLNGSYYMRKIYLNNDIQNLYKDFMPLYEKTKKNIELIPDKEVQEGCIAHLNLYLIRYYLEIGELDKAKAAIDNYPENTPHLEYDKLSFYMDYYGKIKNYSKKKSVINSLKRSEKKNNNNTYDYQISINEFYADYYKNIGKCDKAEELYLEIIDLINKYQNGNPARKYVFYDALSDLYMDRQDIKNAEKYLKMAISVYKQPENSTSHAHFLYKTARLFLLKNQPDEAIKYLIQAEKIQAVVPTNNDLADTYIELGNAYACKGNMDKAISYIEKYINIKEQQYGTDNVEFYSSLLNKADILNNWGYQKEADEIMNKAVSDFENNKIQGENYDFAYNMNLTLAYKYLEQEEFDKALSFVNRALKYTIDSNQHKEVYNLMSDIYGKQGKTSLKLKYKTLSAKYRN